MMIAIAIATVNLGLIGLGNFLGSNLDVVGMLIGSYPVVLDLFNIFVGISGAMFAHAHFTGKCKVA